MAYLYYTLIAIGLYFISDWLLDRLENAYGSRFKYRSLVFLVIISILAITTSQIITFINP